jgi:DNA (cytosine-5)-methyltransferase 1
MIGRSDEHGPAGRGYKKDQSFTLNATAPHAVTYSTPGLGNIKEDTVSSTLLAGQGLAGVGNEQQVPAFVQETTHDVSAGPAGYSTSAIGDIRKDDVSATITANTGGSGETQNPAYIQDTVGTLAPGAHPGGWNGQDAYTGNLIPQQAVRRLTPIECCRLQGFPDNWNDDQTDSQRYRQMGNAVCVPVAEWIGRRITETIK